MPTATLSKSRKKTHVKKGDQVKVISGNHKGETGKIIEVLVKKDRVVVEGVHMITKHAAKSQDRPEGGKYQREGTIHISNVKLITAVTTDEKKAGKTKKEA